MIRLKMKKYDMILTENLPKYQPYHQAKLISMNILLVRILPSNQQQITEQAKFIHSSLRNARIKDKLKELKYIFMIMKILH